jgi:hypothetical protein
LLRVVPWIKYLGFTAVRSTKLRERTAIWGFRHTMKLRLEFRRSH